MSIFRDALGNVIDTNGTSQPGITAAPSADSVPATDSNANPVSDIKYTDPTTQSVIISRA